MHLSYEKLGTDHPMYGKVDAIVMDGMNAVCYKTKDGYQPLHSGTATAASNAQIADAVKTRSLFVLSFKINDDAEEMTFKSKKKMDKTIALYKTKSYVTDIESTEYQTVV